MCVSSTYMVVFAIGRPRGTVPEGALFTRYTDDQMVVSVGPYMFHNSPQRGSKVTARSGGRASPPQSAFKLRSPVQPASTNMRQVTGVACITVAPERVRAVMSRAGSPASSREAISTVAPHTSGRYNSRPAISKDSVVTASSVSSAASPGSRRMLVRKFTTLPCVI